MVKDELRNDNWQEASKKYHNWWFSPNENRLLFTKQDDAWRIGTIRRVHRQTRAVTDIFSYSRRLSYITRGRSSSYCYSDSNTN